MSKIDLTGWQYVDDMIKGTVIVDKIDSLWDAYQYFKNMPHLDEIVKIEENLNTEIKNVIVVFTHYESLIGTVEFRWR